MKRRRVVLIVEVDLDPVAGTCSTPGSWHTVVQRMLDDAVPHYHPEVTVKEIKEPT